MAIDALRSQKQQEDKKAELGYLVAQAQDGDKESRELLLRNYRPFFLRVASQVSKKYLVLGRDDEASIAMLAFDEAIMSYNSEAGASFLSFAELVIKRRMVDFFRRRSRRQAEIPLSALESEDPDDNVVQRIESKQAFSVLKEQEEAEERREEIFRLNQILSDYGILFSDLVDASPKHQDARERALEVAQILASDPKLLQYMTHRKALPLKDLQKLVNVSRKTLERQRKYIITLTLILIGEFYYLQEYLKRS